MTKTKDYRTDTGRVEVEVVGSEPEHLPYLSIRLRDGDETRYLDSLSRNEMRRLARQILSATGG